MFHLFFLTACEARNGTSCEQCLQNVTVSLERQESIFFFSLSTCMMEKSYGGTIAGGSSSTSTPVRLVWRAAYLSFILTLFLHFMLFFLLTYILHCIQHFPWVIIIMRLLICFVFFPSAYGVSRPRHVSHIQSRLFFHQTRSAHWMMPAGGSAGVRDYTRICTYSHTVVYMQYLINKK